jgi:hypothetical protein
MSSDAWILLLTAIGVGVTVVGIAISGVAAWAAIRSAQLTRRGLDKQEEQLRIERELASMIPELKLSKITVGNPSEYEEVSNTLQERDQAIQREADELRQREQQQERESRPRPPGGMGDWLAFDMPVVRPLDTGAFDPFTLEQRDYRGPAPDAVMLIQLRNDGRSAANDITGTITTSAEYVRVLEFPGLDAYDVSEPDESGVHTAELGTISELLPGRTDVFKVGITLGSGGEPDLQQWSVQYNFITPSGHGASGTWQHRPEGSEEPGDT